MIDANRIAVDNPVPGRRLPPRMMQLWQRQCPSFRKIEMGDGTTIYRQGDGCSQVYYLASGHVKLTAIAKDGHGFIRSILRDGDFLGAISGQTEQRMLDSAISKGPARLYRCKANEFVALMGTQPDIARHLLATLSRRLELAQRQTEMILYHPTAMRVASLLHEFVGEHGGHCRHGHEIDFRLTQQELADLVGASRPVVSTILNDLRQRRIVAYTRTFICIENMAALEQLLE